MNSAAANVRDQAVRVEVPASESLRGDRWKIDRDIRYIFRMPDERRLKTESTLGGIECINRSKHCVYNLGVLPKWMTVVPTADRSRSNFTLKSRFHNYIE